MKILFITGLYPFDQVERLRNLSNNNIQNAPNVFQWAVVDGLFRNKVKFEVVSLSFLPSYPKNFKTLYTPSSDILYNGKCIGKMLSYNSLIAYKHYSIQKNLYNYISNWVKNERRVSNETLVLLTYTPYTPFINAAKQIKKEYSNIILSSIVTDLVDDFMNFKENRNIFKRIQCWQEREQTKLNYKYIDKFILLSEAMIERIPEAQKNYIVIEGITTEKELNLAKKDVFKSILYTGTLEEFSGVRNLVKAFHKTNNKDYRLIICGAGSLSSFIDELSSEDSRIIFKGLVPREEAVRLQQSATLLINPRLPDDSITRFSFPSKTMEYLSSGTPMIGYKLDGIPSEYYNYFYTVDDTSEEALTRLIDNVLGKSQSELDTKAKVAFDFVMNNKTSTHQIKKVLDFLSK